MIHLLYKEWRLAVHPVVYMFCLMGALTLVPAYPYGMVFFFGCLGLFFTCQFARENADLFYTMMLPIRKRDAVKSKCLLFVSVELIQLMATVPFAVLRRWALPDGNPVGIEANAAFFGFGLVIYTIYNFVDLIVLFRSGYQVGKAFLAAIVPVLAGIVCMEAAVHIPSLAWLDGMRSAEMVRQLPILCGGIVVFVIGNLLTYRTAALCFETTDL